MESPEPGNNWGPRGGTHSLRALPISPPRSVLHSWIMKDSDLVVPTKYIADQWLGRLGMDPGNSQDHRWLNRAFVFLRDEVPEIDEREVESALWVLLRSGF